MSDILYRHRPLALLAGVILAQVLLLAFQIKREHNVRLIRYWAATILTPPERAGTWSTSKAGGIWRNYIDLRDARTENERLQDEVHRLRIRNRELEGRAGEAERLAVLLNFRDTHREAPMLAAQVIGASADPTSHTLFINRGEHDRIRRNFPVITPDGVVGKIVEVFPSSSQVLLINDKESGVGALFVSSRAHGIVKGYGDPDLRMDYVDNREKIQPGDAVVTSGEDRIFPKDLPVGTVESAATGNPFQVIRVQPAAKLDRLEEVLVLMTQQELAPKKSEETASSAAATKNPAPATNHPAASPAVATPALNTPRGDRAIAPPAAAKTSTNPPAQTSPAAKPEETKPAEAKPASTDH